MRPMVLTASVALLAPLLALFIKGNQAGWLNFFVLLASPLLLAGYVLLVLAARSMLRRGGALRASALRPRARIWAWATSLGVLATTLTIADGHTPETIQSSLTTLLGAPRFPSPVHLASTVACCVAAAAWLAGWAGLLLTWSVARRSSAPLGTSAPALPTS